jgi:hypothetical protein
MLSSPPIGAWRRGAFSARGAVAPTEKTPEQKKKEENAYKNAVSRIPDQKFDPWGKVR